ncbi:MAG: 23S rRNA (uracil(1939)-C(5))-methyltransferase RlmD, partial [Vulcanimicrobiaceae bacterium]
MVVFALGPLPGERARVRVTSVKANYAVGELVELLETSADRVEPFCAVFGRCGGCQVQHLAYDAQLAWKRRIVADALRRIGGLGDVRVLPARGMAIPRNYRNKMSLVVGGAPGARELGFYHAGTHDLVPVHTCPIVMDELDATIGALWEIAADPATADAFDDARHVVARVGRASRRVVVSVSSRESSPALRRQAERVAARLPQTVGLCNSFEPASENAVLGREHTVLVGEGDIDETIDGVHFRVSSGSFFQVNSLMVGEIFRFLQPFVPQNRIVVDLYCGAGTFSLFFANHGARVVGVEENPYAVGEAIRNAERNGLHDKVAFLSGRVERRLQIEPAKSMLASAEVAFLDPPRKGSDEATLDAIVAACPPRIWYLSCNPSTLARDLARLVAGGYRLNVVQPFDMFPHTGHVEALALLDAPG